jgi:glycosyltransferase involved in cell wall biosynthesis
VKFSVVTSHVPDREGAAAARALHALAEGLIGEGHEVSVVTWNSQARAEALPTWCERLVVEPESTLETKLRSVVSPRSESAKLDWRAPDDAVAVADEYPSYPAIAGAERRVLLEHHMTRLDVVATRRAVPADLQRWRAENAALRQASLVVTTSSRVAAAIQRRTSVCPMAYPTIPLLAPVEDPVAGVIGDWRWPPNRWALDRLLRAWPTVRDLVPHARLLVAGHGSLEIGPMAGITALGRVESSLEVLGRCALVPFPCPPSSGPKVKVLEALSAGRPVVTTPAGFEGIWTGPCASEMVSSLPEFAVRVAALLRDPARCAQVGAAARKAVQSHHAPAFAARRFAAACSAQFPDLVSDVPPPTSIASSGLASTTAPVVSTKRAPGSLRDQDDGVRSDDGIKVSVRAECP